MKTFIQIIVVLGILFGLYVFVSEKDDSSSLTTNNAPASQNDDTPPSTPSAEGDESIIINEDQGSLDDTTLTKDVSVTTQNTTWTVSYSNQQFYPESISIKKGDTLRFVNNSNESMIITSSNSAPDIQTSSLIHSGEAIFYTLTHSGKWEYSNQENKFAKGSITVN